MSAASIDWNALRSEANRVAKHAWAPYSGLHIGAAGLTEAGSIVAGCNVENASYGLTLCAECGLVSDLHRTGRSKLVAVSIVNGDDEFVLPCGRCRQVLFEAGGPELLIQADGEPIRLDQLLPNAFGPDDLPPSPA